MWFQHLKLKYDGQLSNFALNMKLRQYGKVISLGDTRSYYLSTAENELGVVQAKSPFTGEPMVPAGGGPPPYPAGLPPYPVGAPPYPAGLPPYPGDLLRPYPWGPHALPCSSPALCHQLTWQPPLCFAPVSTRVIPI